MNWIRLAWRLAVQLSLLCRSKGPFEEIIVQNIAFAVFSPDNPITGLYINEP